MLFTLCRFRLSVTLVASYCLLGATVNMAADPVPDWDGRPGDQTKPVQVYIMLGQSNMLGFGAVGPADKPGTLEQLVREKGMYPQTVNDAGEWIAREDVRYVHVMHRNGNMGVVRNEWLTPNKSFGPELGFGHVVGNAHEAPVLLLKACIGNRSLGWDLLPPGSESFEFEGKVYAGYKQSPLSWEVGTEPQPIEWYAGKQYDDDVANAKTVLANLADYYPGYNGQGYEVAGFVWWQGHKDQNPAHAGRYEQNLVRLIKQLRAEFDAPEAKFVLATIAFDGDKISGPGLTIVEAQLAVDGDSGRHPEFKGNVAAIDARPFWRTSDVSPNAKQGYHYFHNAETYMEVGDSLGRARAELERGQ
ncbi:MAG: sialate O-acetylesterase [Planctomycetaceae bacterium]